MKKRIIGYAIWLALAGLLYFFENNAGTRIVLGCSCLLPFVPVIRRELLAVDAVSAQPRPIPQTVKAFADRAADDPGDVRAYLPGDPVNRIHWKLSAKRDELLVRAQDRGQTAEEAEKKAVARAATPAADHTEKRWLFAGFLILLISCVLLFVIPSARQGMQALLNRLFDASEAVNAYAYERFAVSAGQSTDLAAALLSVMGLALIGMTVVSGSRLAALGLMTASVLFQAYFGLAFPAWVQVPLLALFALWMLRRPINRRAVLCALTVIIAVTLAVLLLYPGVDAATEAVSEHVRDQLSRMAQSVTGGVTELPAGENEVRHAHTQALAAGDREAQTGREFRLVTVEEQQISKPHWVDYLRIALLLALTAAAVILPFLPFILLNRRRQKALNARKAFQSENVSEAIFAIFQHVAAWLEATGNGGGNAPYAAWQAALSPAYAQRFAACEKLFEEAAYSTHPMTEEQRQQALELLDETERALQARADWKQRLRLRYKECLWV